MSVDEVAARLGVHPTTVLRWERRERLPAPVHITGLAGLLGLDRDVLADHFDDARRARYATGAVRAPGSSTRSARAVPLPRAAPSPLAVLRRRAGLSGVRAARLAGVSRDSLASWERGAAPPLAALRTLGAVYGVRVGVVAAAARVQPPAALDRRSWRPGDLPVVVRTLRLWAGLGQADLASRCGCSTDAVRAWERGRARPSSTSRAALERAFGLEAGALEVCLPGGPSGFRRQERDRSTLAG